MRTRVRAKRWLRDRGIELVLPRRSGSIRPFRDVRLERVMLPAEVARTVDRQSGTMVVAIDRMVNRAGFGFSPNAWHPYVAALEERLADPGIGYGSTVLAAFFEAFRPTTIHDVLLGDLATEPGEMASWPAVNRLIDIWSTTESQVEDARRDIARRGALPTSQYRGPMSEEAGRSYLDGLVAIHQSMADPSYRPRRLISGYFLTRGDDYRFVIGYGDHRAAALRALSQREVTVTFRRSHLPVVADERLDRWTTAQGGLLAPHEARAVFDRFFADDSRARAAAMGLL